MALFKATIRRSGTINGVRIEQGMSVNFPSMSSSPLLTNGGKEVNEAFLRVYGIDMKQKGLLNSSNVEVVKIG